MMIEKTVLDYLSNELSVPVYMEVPENPPSSYVIIQKTAGSITDYINSATLAIQSVAASLLNAATLNDTIIEKMVDIWKYKDVSRSSLNSNYNFTDSRTKQYRYQAVFDLTY